MEEVLNVYGNRKGCEVCKPALSYHASIWFGAAVTKKIAPRDSSTIEFTPTFKKTEHFRSSPACAEASPRLTNCAASRMWPTNTKCRMVKVTGSQRIDLLGIKKSDLPKVWADLGMTSGQAYTKGVRMVKTCVGTEFCRFGVQDSTNTGIELERRYENLFTPHKFKMGGGRLSA